MTTHGETRDEQRQRRHDLGAVSLGRGQGDRAEAAWRDAGLAGKPRVALACGHLSPAGSGPLAQAGRGYCPEHGVSRILAAPAPG